MIKSTNVRKHVELVIDSVTLAVFFLLFFIGGYAIVDANIVDSGTQVDEEVLALAPQSEDSEFNFDELKSINPDIIAWLRLDDTHLDYPVVQTDDNSTYLVRDYRGEYSTSGAIFIDSRNNKFLDDFTIVYGHRVDGTKMFGEIAKFEEKAFFDSHTTGTLYTEDSIYDLGVLAYAVVNIGTTGLYRLDTNRTDHNSDILQEVWPGAKYRRDMPENSSQIIMLSTCDRDSKNYRDVLLLSATKR